VNDAVADSGEDEIMEGQGFINPHYFAAGATLFGGEAQGAYQYADQEYAGQLEHVAGANTCVECHDPHGLTVETESCETCHDTEDIETIRMSEPDFDGDGDTEEGLAMEISTMRDMVYAALQDYAASVLEAPIVYAEAYPYFFNDSNGNGEADPDEANYGNRYQSWSPRLLKAAYNYQYVDKDPGAYTHNGAYILQVLYDTLSSLGEQVAVDQSGMTRP
jgi:hypothetical protein